MSRVKTDWSPLEDVDVGRAGAGVEQHDHRVGVDAVVDLVGVLEREGVDVDDHRGAPGLGDHAGVVGDLLFLRGDQQHVHRPLAAGGVAAVEDLVVEVDVLDVERDVLLGFPVDRLGELGLGHHRQRDLLDDDGVARERGGDVLGLDAAAVEQAADRVGHGGAIDDRAVDDAVGRHRLGAEAGHLVALAGRLQLDRLDGARADVEADEGFRSTKHRVVLSFGIRRASHCEALYRHAAHRASEMPRSSTPRSKSVEVLRKTDRLTFGEG